jgi:formate--tetrahydrofolate ligase
MPWDSTQLADWQIAEEAEKNMPKPYEVADRLGMKQDEVIPYGRVSRLDYMKILDRLKDRPQGKYIEITAITPTPLGEGKTTTTMGIIEGLAKRAAFRRPDLQHQGYCGRRRQLPVDSDDRVLPRPHR